MRFTKYKMTNICSRCGNECDESDLYCSKCGNKLNAQDEMSDSQSFMHDDSNAINEAFYPRKKELENKKAKGVFDSYILNLVILFFIFVVVLSLVSAVMLNKQNSRRMELQYRNLMSNPAQIPQLKEPISVDELAANMC